MTDVVERAEAMLGAITPGEWRSYAYEHGKNEAFVSSAQGPVCYVGARLMSDTSARLDAEFIASARNLVPELVAEVKRLREQVAAVNELAGVMKAEHGQSWNSISGHRIRRALGVTGDE
ncbi:hypothetical protein I5G97_gp017 [Mycobacterium phage Curiosium]|uniref:Uncharacterized protein n=1 Tax=Mycobacterium phage Curiosium TaxID=2599859 RepID=A0A5J6TTQ6_9CAUD|nr:hypothetical protein I5G97_gp017 [Mycobacterium phage Curiosium]QFG14136.1 hypothetical protein PBI_CURIOSIUM_93 [Mycobacterium phage Curiosium]